MWGVCTVPAAEAKEVREGVGGVRSVRVSSARVGRVPGCTWMGLKDENLRARLRLSAVCVLLP